MFVYADLLLVGYCFLYNSASLTGASRVII